MHFNLKDIDFYGQALGGNDCFKGFRDNRMVATEVLRVNYNLRQSTNLRNKLHLIEKIQGNTNKSV